MNEKDRPTDEHDTDWYTSAVDAWLAILLISVPIVSVAVLAVAVIEGEGVLVAAIACVFVAALYAAVVHPVRYGLADDHLVVRFGLVRQRVPYRDIRSVRPTRSPLSSPALSLNRLRVQHGEGFFHAVLISPTRRDAFLDALALRTALQRRGDTLTTPHS